jgi:hypothetical protein
MFQALFDKMFFYVRCVQPKTEDSHHIFLFLANASITSSGASVFRPVPEK